MAKNLSLSFDTTSLLKSLKRITRPIQAHHMIIMFVLLMGVLIYTVIVVSSAIQPVDDSDYRATAEARSITTSFDQSTIQKVDSLKQRDDNAPIDLPSGRRNPFVN